MTTGNGKRAVPWYRSIRFKLVAAAITVELCMLGVLLANSYRLVNEALESQTRARLEALAPLLNASLAGYVFQRDHSEIEAILNDLIESDFTEIRYIVVLDHHQRIIASVGSLDATHLPSDKSEDHSVREALSDLVYDTSVPLTLPGNDLGSVRFGLSLVGMVSLRDTVLGQSLLIAALELVLSLLLLTSGGYLITRHVATLLGATRRVASGDFGSRIAIGGNDEISVIAADFNHMAAAVENQVNALRESEAALRESEGRFRSIFDNVSEAIFVHDAASLQVVDVNRRVCEMYGFASRDEALESQFNDFSAGVSPYSESDVRAHMRKAIEAGPQTFEWHARKKGGELFWVEVSLRLTHIGEQPYLLAVVRDISERKAMVAELRTHRDNLEELVTTRTAELSAARQEAEHLARVKSEFLSNMSHEIRTPLNAVMGLARIGARDSGEAVSQLTFNRILDSSEHLLVVINDILDLSKIEAGKLQIEPRQFSIHSVVEGAVRLVAAQAAAKGLALEVSIAPQLTERVKGDAQRLSQILINLLSNAVKFTETGEVRVRVGADGDYTYFKVIDTGIGMNEREMQNLFKPFEQADNSTTRRFGGTGLGLAISQALAHLMGGHIAVDSTPAAGSSFTLALPLPPAAEAEEPRVPLPAAQAAGQELNGLRILAAEDVEVNRLVLQDMLCHEGARVVFAENGLQAVERIEQHGRAAFDVVLMDIQMPVMDGFAATRRIHAIAPDLPVIGLTAHALADERQRCIDAGMADHVSKPIDPLRLSAVLAKYLPKQRPEAPAAEPVAAAVATVAAVVPAALPGGESDAQLLQQLATVPGLDLKQGLAALRGRVASYARLLRKYAEGEAAGLGHLAERLAAADVQERRRLAHTLKGSSGTLGVAGVQRLALALEMALRDGREVGAAIQELEAELQRVVPAILAALPAETVVASPEACAGDVRSTLRQLETLLADGNTEVGRTIMQVAPLLRQALGEEALELERLVDGFQYPLALEKVRALLQQA